MRQLPTALFLASSLLACSADSAGSDDSDAGASADASSSVATGDCEGASSRLVFHGSVERSITPLVYVSVGGQIKGFGAPQDSLSFKTSSSALEGYVHDVGTYDVALPTHNMVFVDYEPGDPLCESEPCEGFYALSGRYEVTEHDVQYRAEFELADLHELGTDGPGAAIAGSITGCLVVDAAQ